MLEEFASLCLLFYPWAQFAQGWWWRAISLAANQCHWAETSQETIPT